MLILYQGYHGDYAYILGELLCQMTMGQIPALEYMLSVARGLMWPRPIIPGDKCHCILRLQHR
jgi:hypothetical protein